MEVIYVAIVPIGGILAVLGILILVALIGIWQELTSNSQIFMDFALANTDVILFVFLGIFVLLSIAMMIILSSDREGLDYKKGSPFFRISFSLLSACPLFFTLTLLYAVLIDLGHSLLGVMDDMIVFIVALLVAFPICLAIFLFLLCAAILINAVPFYFMFEGFLENTKGKVLISILNLIISFVAIYFILCHTSFPTYAWSSFLL